jgi:hypothetical protein
MVKGTCCGQRKDEVSESSVPQIISRDMDLFPAVRGEPLDFQDLDSRFSFTLLRSLVAGTFLSSYSLFKVPLNNC